MQIRRCDKIHDCCHVGMTKDINILELTAMIITGDLTRSCLKYSLFGMYWGTLFSESHL